MKKKRRFLCCRGGGIYGYWSARVLQKIERWYPWAFSPSLDITYAGVSTGALISAAGACNISYEIVSDLYSTHGRRVFSRPICRKLFSPFGGRWSLYSSQNLIDIAHEVFGNVTFHRLSRQSRHLFITTIRDAGDGEGAKKCNVHNIGTKEWDDLTVAQVAAVSCCEPYYFDTVELPNYGIFTGGGWAGNDPTLSVVSESLRAKPLSVDEEVVIFTVGTGDKKISLYKGSPGASWWITRLVPLRLDLDVDDTCVEAKKQFGERYFLMNDPDLPDGDMDDPKLIPLLEDHAKRFDIGPALDFISKHWA